MGYYKRRRYCSSCNKPLGSTFGKCHSCGGESSRGSDRCDGREWKLVLGVPMDTIVAAEREYGSVLPLEG